MHGRRTASTVPCRRMRRQLPGASPLAASFALLPAAQRPAPHHDPLSGWERRPRSPAPPIGRGARPAAASAWAPAASSRCPSLALAGCSYDGAKFGEPVGRGLKDPHLQYIGCQSPAERRKPRPRSTLTKITTAAAEQDTVGALVAVALPPPPPPLCAAGCRTLHTLSHLTAQPIDAFTCAIDCWGSISTRSGWQASGPPARRQRCCLAHTRTPTGKAIRSLLSLAPAVRCHSSGR